MTGNEKIRKADIPRLTIIKFPDPRLREVCTEIEDPSDPAVRALAERMKALMFESRGVGLAAPQVGITVRMFLGSPEFDPENVPVYINPKIVSVDGQQDGDEGCLSFPGIYCKVKRYAEATIRAFDLDGHEFEQTGTELTARLFQHETDHLDGRLLVDRMSALARMANRKALRELEAART